MTLRLYPGLEHVTVQNTLACSASGQACWWTCSMPFAKTASALAGSRISMCRSQRIAAGTMPVAASARACTACMDTVYVIDHCKGLSPKLIGSAI